MVKTEKWVTVKEFMKHYALSVGQAYQYIHAKGFPSKRVGEKSYRVDINATDKWFEEVFPPAKIYA